MTDIEAAWDFRDPYIWMQKTARSALPPLIITAAISGGGHGKRRGRLPIRAVTTTERPAK